MENRIFFFLFLLTICNSASAADIPIAAHAQKLKSRQFLLKAPDQLFQSYKIGSWSPKITQTYAAVDPGAADDLLGTHILHPAFYTVGKVDYSKKKNRIEVEMEKTSNWKLNILFENANTLSTEKFDRMFHRLFFRPDENVEDYLRLNSLKLAEQFLDTAPVLRQLPAQDKIRLIAMIALLSEDSIPSFTPTSKGPFIHIQLPHDYSECSLNDSKRIIANAIETQLGRLKLPAALFQALPAVAGIHYQWSFLYTDAGDIGIPGFGPRKDADFELLATKDSILQLASGDIAPHDFAVRSVLILNRQPISFTSWESSWKKEIAS